MTEFDYDYARAVSADRIRRAAMKSHRSRLQAAAGTDHPVRRLFAALLIHLGLRL